MSDLIFEKSRGGRRAFAQAPSEAAAVTIPEQFLREDRPRLPEASELQTVRHFTRLSQKNFSIDTQFYPLGSCTMKYNPRACNALALLPEFAARHPLGPVSHGQGFLSCMFELQEMLKDVTGMKGVSLTPMAGAQGELAGVAMIKAYHDARGDAARNEIIVPDAAHGTNPATATMCGCIVKEIPTRPDGDVDMDSLKAVLGPNTAGIMLTNPSTLGVFERHIKHIADLVHDAGGLLYYDGANLNAILGKVRPGDMDFDVIHMNLHKTFSTPHGGGGPGSGAVGVNKRDPVRLGRRGGCSTEHRETFRFYGQCGRSVACLRLHAHGWPRRHGTYRRICDAQCQLPDGSHARCRLRAGVPRAACEP
jgi:glycine dehydrogenase subunit 2